jgi:hypothetical protein
MHRGDGLGQALLAATKTDKNPATRGWGGASSIA